MVSLKLFAEYFKTATATDDEVCERPVNRLHQEWEPELREQRVLETRRWHDPSRVTCRIRENE